MPTVTEVFDREQENFSPVPTVANEWVCNICLGPCRPRYGNLCRGCQILFEREGAPPSLRSRIVPMTAVLERGRWYYVLRTYKRGLPDEHMPILVALARSYLDEHRENIADLLGGDPTIVTIVPSKREDTFDSQPLREVVEYTIDLRGNADRLGHTLRFAGDQETDYRQQYFPSDFDRGPRDVEGERVLVIEDGWASGATAVSTAGAILDNGAESAAILSLARLINPDYWSEGHPYRQFMDREYDLSEWPR